MDFNTAFDRLLAHEGGHVNDPRDAGGETQFGISARAYPQENIAGLTIERAREIYRRDYWGPMRCEEMPAALRFELFDMAVNMGQFKAVTLLQEAVGAADDGVLGPDTLRRLQAADPQWILRRLQGARLDAYTRAKAWPSFSAGWVRRVARNMMAG